MISLTVKAPKVSRSTIARLGGFFVDRVGQLATQAFGYAKSPQKRRTLHVRTGKLMASISKILRKRGNVIEAGVASSHPAAAAIEYGGTHPAHTLEAKRGEALRFTVGGETLYRRFANIPAYTVPPHPFLAPSVRRAGRDFRKDIRAAMKRASESLLKG